MNDKPIWIDYTNHRGERRWRHIEPRRIYWGSTVWHPHPQWLMHAFDVEKLHDRDFALTGIHEWSDQPPDMHAAPLSNDAIDAIADSIMEPLDSGDAAQDEMERVLMRRFARACIRAASAPAGAHAEPAAHDTHSFKNFHDRLCRRFGYSHDPVDWRRDLVSLEEHIAAMVSKEPAGDAGMPVVELENSPAAQAAIADALREYGYPVNTVNAARAGWRACRLQTVTSITALKARIADLESGWKDRASADVCVLLAEYHREVWDAATAAEDGRPPVDYDIAGVETAKKIVAAAHARDAEVAAMRERVEFHRSMTRDAQEIAAAAQKRVRELEVVLQSVMDAHCKYSQAPDDNDSKEWEALKAAHASSRAMLKRAGAASPPVAGGR